MRYLTKSRFITAITCPTKLRYLDDPEYANSNATNDFLKALADGGHQIGALAKCLFPDGIEVDEVGHDAQVERTLELLARDNVVLFEAAFRVGRLFVRVDLLRKEGNTLELYEVKSKSYNSELGIGQVVKKTGVASEFKPYLYDIAFQRHVVSAALPSCEIRCHLVMPDKAKACLEDAIPQRLAVKRTEQQRVTVEIDPSLRDGKIAAMLLAVLPVDDFLEILLKSPLDAGGYIWAFEDAISEIESQLNGDFPPKPGTHCRSCEFRAVDGSSLKDGRSQCWSESFGIAPETLAQGTIFDLNNFRATAALVGSNIVRLHDVDQSDIKYSVESSKLTTSHRQWLQCEEARGNVSSPFVIRPPLSAQLDALNWPLHFIDFESATPPLPYHAGMRPYETVLFQFSHHRMDVDGSVRHASQLLEATPELCPSFSVVRALRDQLSVDGGSVLHWWTHERTVLTQIRDQLGRSSLPDREDLIRSLDDLLPRLVDLGQHISHPHVFFPGTKGSGSIKKVLPAVLRHCSRVRDSYAMPTYGSPLGISSLNFSNRAWVQMRDGIPVDPYELLSARFDDRDLDQVDELDEGHAAIDNGGAAMIAYGLLQATKDAAARRKLEEQLLRYCELDTLAMVIAYQGLRDLVDGA